MHHYETREMENTSCALPLHRFGICRQNQQKHYMYRFKDCIYIDILLLTFGMK